MISTKAMAAVAAAMMVVGSGAAMAKVKTLGTTVHSPESIECSKEADAKGLHGKERKKFRAECKKSAHKAEGKKPEEKKS
jgi:psiF repeat